MVCVVDYALIDLLRYRRRIDYMTVSSGVVLWRVIREVGVGFSYGREQVKYTTDPTWGSSVPALRAGACVLWGTCAVTEWWWCWVGPGSVLTVGQSAGCMEVEKMMMMMKMRIKIGAERCLPISWIQRRRSGTQYRGRQSRTCCSSCLTCCLDCFWFRCSLHFDCLRRKCSASSFCGRHESCLASSSCPTQRSLGLWCCQDSRKSCSCSCSSCCDRWCCCSCC